AITFYLLKPYYHYHRNFFVGFETFFIKSINDKSSSKTKVKNILYGTMIINLLLRLPFNRYIIVTVRCHIFFSQRDKTRVLRCKDKNSVFLQQFINSHKKWFN